MAGPAGHGHAGRAAVPRPLRLPLRRSLDTSIQGGV
jgi:hypothetical protein